VIATRVGLVGAGVARGAAAAPLWSAGRLRARSVLGWDPGDVASRVIVGALFLLLALRIAANTAATGRLTGLLLVASEALVVVLMIVRRRTDDVDRRAIARLITALSIVGPPLVLPLATPATGTDVVTTAVSAVGLTLVVAAKIALGRSFGLVPANRGVVARGPYRFVRHPIYLGYAITHLAFVVANPLWWNVWMLGVADTALVVRLLYEERTLARDAQYVEYCERVRWRLVPGMF
jgi:protein-S-isoprenylcysteine O-methyltransferase Ste14